MSDGWYIKFDKDMVDDPRMVEAALEVASNYVLAKATPGGGIDLEGVALLSHARNTLLGALLVLWRYADEHILDDNTLPVRYAAIDALVGLDGFADAIPDCWLVELKDGTVKLPGYVEKNGLITKRKRVARNRERQAKWRANHPKGNARNNATGNAVHNASVTRYEGVTPPDQNGGDGDGDSKRGTLRSSSSGDLSPSPSGRVQEGDKTVSKNRPEENRLKLKADVADLMAGKKFA